MSTTQAITETIFETRSFFHFFWDTVGLMFTPDFTWCSFLSCRKANIVLIFVHVFFKHLSKSTYHALRLGDMMPLFLFIWIFYSTYIHSITFILYIHPSPFAKVPFHLLIAGQLSEKNLLGVPPSRESNSAATPHPLCAAPYPYWATPHPFWATPQPYWATPHPYLATLHPYWATPPLFWATPQ